MRFAAFILLLVIVVSLPIAPAWAPDITLTFDANHVQVKMALSVHQNMTELPDRVGSLNETESQNATAAITDALQKISPGAVLSGVNIDVNSNKTWLNLTLTMDVAGISQPRGDVMLVNTTWRAFNVSADLRTANISYNTFGIRYLRPVIDFYLNASRFETSPNATIKAVTFFEGNQSVAGEEAANHAGNMTIFDFRSLDLPLDRWTRTYSLDNNTTTWRYTPAPALVTSVRAERLNQSYQIFSNYAFSAEAIVPGLARAEGNTMFVDVGTGQKELIMTSIVLAAIVLAVVSQLYFRSRRRAARMKRR